MRKCIGRIEDAIRTLGKPSPWDPNCKTSDEFLDGLFDAYFRELGLPNLMRKGGLYRLAEHISEDETAPEVREKLDSIACVARSVKEDAILTAEHGTGIPLSRFGIPVMETDPGRHGHRRRPRHVHLHRRSTGPSARAA